MTLWLVYVEGADAALDETPEIRRLRAGLYLVRSDDTRSKLYHAIKRSLAPEVLLVAPLGDAPKFKGMDEGALKWLRRHDLT